jgi:hypothetical protein
MLLRKRALVSGGRVIAAAAMKPETTSQSMLALAWGRECSELCLNLRMVSP